MKYYLVALFDKESYSYMEGIQKDLSRKYKLYRNTPMLHITLEIVDEPDMDKLSKIISDILKPYKKFKVEVNGAMCFDPPHKSVNLRIENKGYIMRLERVFNDTLKLHGFKVRETINDWDLHVAVANTNFAQREWSAREYVAACSSAKKENIYKMAKIDRIELWKPINNRKEMIVASFPLRDY